MNRTILPREDNDTIQFAISFEARGLRAWLRKLMARPDFGEGSSESMSSALARPFTQLAETGNIVGRINYVFFDANKWPTHVLGSLCLAPSERVLFFPGLLERNVVWQYAGASFKGIQSRGLVDHLTLEKGFQKWHVTILESDRTKKTRLQSFPTKRVSEQVTFWFGLSIQGLTLLETTPAKLTMTFPAPPSDSIRRGEELIKAREDAVFHITTMDHGSLSEREFVHFDFFIGPDDTDIEALPCFVPTKEPLVHNYAKPFTDGWHFRGHPVSLEGMSMKVWIVVSKHVGDLKSKTLIAAPER